MLVLLSKSSLHNSTSCVIIVKNDGCSGFLDKVNGHNIIFPHKSFNSVQNSKRCKFTIEGDMKYFPGEGILALGDPPKDKLHSHRLKGIRLSFQLLKNALSGGYVNFGVFRLYNDPALDNALHMFVKMVMSVESSNLLVSGFVSSLCKIGQRSGYFDSKSFNFFNRCVLSLAMAFHAMLTARCSKMHSTFAFISLFW